MSIRERRLDKAINAILREELQKGNLPSSKEFVWRLNQYLQEHSLSSPEFEFKPVRKGSVARSSDVNQTLKSVYNDFDTLYVSVIDQHTSSIKHFNKFEVEKAKLDYQINQLEAQLKELILLYSEEGFLNSVYDVFADMSKIDTSKTTTSIDIAKHEIKINDVKSRSKKIVPNASARFEILPQIKNLVTGKSISGTPQDALSENANSTWQYQATTDTKMNVGGYFTVTFAAKQEMNRISLVLQNIKPTYIKVEFTPDNINWVALPYYESGISVTGEYNFDFPTLEVNSIRFLMGKTEPDNEELGNKVGEVLMPSDSSTVPSFTTDSTDSSIYYGTNTANAQAQTVSLTYLFGIKSLSFYQLTYATDAVFYSKTLTVDDPSNKNFTIDKVSLNVEEELPNGTDIKYYIALPPAEGAQPEWKAISPTARKNPQYDQMIDYKNISTSVPSTFAIDPTISIGEYEQESLYANGIKFYKIGEITDRKIIPGTEKLFVGKDSWGKKSYVYTQADGHVPSASDWSRPQTSVTVDYTKIEDGKPGLVLNKQATASPTNFLFTLGVFSNKANELVSATPISTDPIAIYMNGSLLFKGVPTSSTKLNYLFQNGWNEIIVMVYTSATTGTVNGASVDINFDPRKYGSSVYSKAKPLTRVSIFDLRYNTLNTDYDKFAIVEVNNKSQVILNNAVPGLEYDFYYNYIDGTVANEILLKAEFKRDDTVTNTSPKLKSYRLRFS